MALLVAVIGAVCCVYAILAHESKDAPSDTEIWPVMEHDPTWDHEFSCRCRTCRN